MKQGQAGQGQATHEHGVLQQLAGFVGAKRLDGKVEEQEEDEFFSALMGGDG